MPRKSFFSDNQAYVIAAANGVGLLCVICLTLWVQVNTPSKTEYKDYQITMDSRFDRVLANQERIYNEIRAVDEQNVKDIEILRQNSEGLRDHEYRIRHIEGNVLTSPNVEPQP